MKNVINKGRDSNFELLRIMAMLTIIIYHWARHTPFEFESTLTFNRLFVEFWQGGAFWESTALF